MPKNLIRLHAPRLHRRRIACDPRQLLLPLGKILSAAYRMAHALPRIVANKAVEDALRRLITQLQRKPPISWWSTGVGPLVWPAVVSAGRLAGA